MSNSDDKLDAGLTKPGPDIWNNFEKLEAWFYSKKSLKCY